MVEETTFYIIYTYIFEFCIMRTFYNTLATPSLHTPFEAAAAATKTTTKYALWSQPIESYEFESHY